MTDGRRRRAEGIEAARRDNTTTEIVGVVGNVSRTAWIKAAARGPGTWPESRHRPRDQYRDPRSETRTPLFRPSGRSCATSSRARRLARSDACVACTDQSVSHSFQLGSRGLRGFGACVGGDGAIQRGLQRAQRKQESAFVRRSVPPVRASSRWSCGRFDVVGRGLLSVCWRRQSARG